MRPTLRDVARDSGYEASTVSRVLRGDKASYASEEARRAILESAARLKYRANYFASVLRSQQSTVIGIVGHLFGSEISSIQAAGFVEQLRQKGFVPIFAETWGDPALEKQALGEVLHFQVAGIVLSGTMDVEMVRRMLPEEVPSVLIGQKAVPGFTCLVVDRAASTKRAVERLVALGHKEIAYVTQAVAANQLKIEGYTAAMRAGGVHDAGLVIETTPEAGSTRAFMRAHRELFQRVTAVVAASDIAAAEVIAALTDLELRVPEDVSVVGYDDMPLALATVPPLATLRQPRDEIGQHVVRMLLDRIEGRTVENEILIPELIERGSIGPCRPVGRQGSY